MIWSRRPRSRCARRKARFSCRSWKRSSAFSTMSFNSSTSKGFWMKSSAPSLKASRAVSTVAKAVINTTPTSGRNSRRRRSSSMPFMSGIFTSETMRSAGVWRKSSKAFVPFSAVRTACPARPKTCDSNCRMPGSSSTMRRFAIVSKKRLTLFRGQFYRDGCPMPLAAADVDCTTVVADYLVDDGETQTRPARRRGGEGLEESFDLRGRHAAPGVGEGDADATRGRAPHLCAERPAVGHRLQRIACEIPEDLPDSFGVGHRQHGLLGQVLFKLVPVEHLGAVAHEREGLAQGLAQVTLGERELARARVDEKVCDDAVEAVGLTEHDVHQLALRGISLKLRAQDLNRAAHRRQGVAYLVRDAGRDAPHGRQALLPS